MATPEPAIASPSRYGEVFDRGYRHYDGPRLGRRHAFWALVRYSAKRAMGIKKSWTAKVLPILLYLGVAVPVVVSLGIRAFFPAAEVLDYPDFFGFIFILEGIFVATIAPELLCPDRQERVLTLYFSRAITRLDYLLAKLTAAALLTLTMSLVPASILWLGRQLLSDTAVAAMRDNLDDLGRIIVVGTTIALYLGAIGLAISAFTGRKAVAVAVIIVGFIVSESLAGGLTAAFQDESWVDYLLLLSPTFTTGGLVGEVFNEPGLGLTVPLWVIGATMGGVILLCLLVMAWRYLPDE